MKTAISIPDQVYEKAEQAARRLGLSRSELYVTALVEFLANYDDAQVTRRLNEVYETEGSVLDPGLVELQRRSLGSDEW